MAVVKIIDSNPFLLSNTNKMNMFAPPHTGEEGEWDNGCIGV